MHEAVGTATIELGSELNFLGWMLSERLDVTYIVLRTYKDLHQDLKRNVEVHFAFLTKHVIKFLDKVLDS